MWYALLIGMLQWMIEINRVDIITKVSNMASQMAAPQEVHLDALLHMFGFMQINHNLRMAYDPSRTRLLTWPPSSQTAGSSFTATRQRLSPVTGFIVFMNTALIQWFSKQQATIETSVFGAEFVAMKIGMEC